jgi:HEAT repeat protein
MRYRWLALLFLTGLLLTLAANPARTDDSPTVAEEKTLKSAGIGTDGPALLDFFRKRTGAEANAEKISALVKQLSDKDVKVRDKASGELVSLGAVAIPWLRQAAKDPDELETAERAKKCLGFIEGSGGAGISVAAARVLAQRKPADAVGVLLAYLPFADDDQVVEEVKGALTVLAIKDGKPDPALLKALDDSSSLTRAVAAECLCQPGGEEPLPAVRKLLKDPKATVRLRAGLALAEYKDQEAVAALVGLVGELPVVQGKLAEEYLVNLAGEQAPKVVLSDDASRAKVKEAWATWWKGTEGGAPLDEFKKRTLTDDTRAKAAALIQQLGDENFSQREAAMKKLKELGAAIMPLLRQSCNDPDAEISARCKKTLAELAKAKTTPLSSVTVRIVALRKPAGAAEVLLAYLPSSEDELIAGEVQTSLNAVAFRDGKIEPAVIKALGDKAAVRRAAAAEALCQSTNAEHLQMVRKLLKDGDALVRLNVALALAHATDKEAVPVLIASLAEAPAARAPDAEQFLMELAGDKAPKESLGDNADSRKKCREAWDKWWKDNGAKITLARANRLRERELGFTILAENGNMRVAEIGLDGKERWHIDNLQYPWDAQWLPGDKVLIAEFNGGQVSERNLKGDVLWKKTCNNPIACQRLRNGNTFIVTRNQIMEVNRDGKELMTINRNWDIMGAKKLKNGQIVMFSNNSTAIFFDAAGKELKNFNIGNGGVQWGGGDVTERGHVIVPQWQQNKIVEYDRDGKAVWEANFQWPSTCQRLANGNTLVASQNTNKVAEINRAGKVVWEHQSNMQVFRVHRR